MEPAAEFRVPGSVPRLNAMPAASSERKLTAVVVADVVGYSRLTAADEEGTIARLRDMKTTILDPAVARHHGSPSDIDLTYGELGAYVMRHEISVEGPLRGGAGVGRARRAGR